MTEREPETTPDAPADEAPAAPTARRSASARSAQVTRPAAPTASAKRRTPATRSAASSAPEKKTTATAKKAPAKKTTAARTTAKKASAKKATASPRKTTSTKAAATTKSVPAQQGSPSRAPAERPRDPALLHRPRPSVDPTALRPRIGPAYVASGLDVPDVPGRHLRTVAPLTDDESQALAELVQSGIEILRAGARVVGIDPQTAERAIAGLLAFVRRRITGQYTLDDLGFDADFTDNVYLPLLRPLYRHWFRVEVRGIENIPSQGGALLVGNHSGTIALDALMVQVALADEHPERRRLRVLGADLVFATPYVGEVARRAGATLASNPDAERLLSGGEIVGVWPEGFKGVGKPFSERYRLQRFGRGGFVAAALRTQVPIIPCSVVGAEETYPMLGNSTVLARLFGLPYFPLTPTYPWFGVLGMIPLPTKWTIEFGAPIATDAMDPALAEDPVTVLDLTDTVRETIQESLYRLLVDRRSVFRG